MSRMSGILISRYIYLWFTIPFVCYCFQPDKIVCICGTASPILMGFSAKQSSLIALQNEFKNKNLIVPDIRLMSLDRITNTDHQLSFIRFICYSFTLMSFIITNKKHKCCSSLCFPLRWGNSILTHVIGSKNTKYYLASYYKYYFKVNLWSEPHKTVQH